MANKSEKEDQAARVSIILGDLIRSQNVKPVTDLNKLSELWPVDDDPNELIEFILNERKARRELPERAMLKDSQVGFQQEGRNRGSQEK